MKRVIIILFALLPIFAAAQNEGSNDGLINKGSGILYFEGRPNFDPTPFTDASEFAIDLNTKKVYVYSGSGSVWNRYNAIDTLSTLADTANVDNRIGQLVYVNGVDQYWHVRSNGFFYQLETGGGSGSAGKCDSLIASQPVDTSYLVLNCYSGGSVVDRDTVWFPTINGGTAEVDSSLYVTTTRLVDSLNALQAKTVDTLSSLSDTTAAANIIGRIAHIMDIDQKWTVNSAGNWEVLSGGGGTDLTGTPYFVQVSGPNARYFDRAVLIADGTEDHVQFAQALDTLAANNLAELVIDGTFTWGFTDSLNLLSTIPNLVFRGASGKALLDTINVPAGWNATVPLIRINAATGDTLQRIVFKDIVFNALGSGNAAQGLRTGVIRWGGGGRIERLEFDNVEIHSVGNFQSSVAFKFEDTNTPGSIGEIKVNDCYFYSDVFNSTGQYGFYNNIPCERFIWDHSDVLMDGDTTGGNTFNAIAVYGGGDYASVTNSKIESLDRSHSPLAFSAYSYVNATGNTVIGGENENEEALIEIERKKDGHVAAALESDTVRYFNFSSNIVEWLNEGPTATNYGFFVTDRDVGADTLRVLGGTISGNTIIGATNGVFLQYAKNVIVSGNSYLNCTNDVAYGRTDLGNTILGSSHYNNIQADGANGQIGIYDNALLVFEPFITQLNSGTNRYRFGDFINHYGDLNRVDFGDASTQVTTRFFSNRFEIINSDLSVYIGEEAGDNATGLFGTFGGYRAGRYNIGTSNTGWGAQVMSSASFTGVANVGVGTDALKVVTSGGSNTSVGYRNLQSLTTGNNMSTLGREGFQYATTASNSAGLGFKHGLYENCTDCVIIGANAGKQTSPAQSLAGIVLIGHDVGQNNTSNNRLMIDNTNTETPLIDGDFVNNALTINGELEVTSHINVVDGYRVGGAAATGEYLRGNGTNFVSSTIQESDLPDRPISAITGLAHNVTTATTDASGDIVVTHGLGATPTTVLITGGTNDDRTYQVLEASKNSTQFTVRVYDAGTALVSSSATFNWIAIQ